MAQINASSIAAGLTAAELALLRQDAPLSETPSGPPPLQARSQGVREYHDEALRRSESMASCPVDASSRASGTHSTDCDSNKEKSKCDGNKEKSKCDDKKCDDKKSDSDSNKAKADQDARKQDHNDAQKIMQGIAKEAQQHQQDRHKIAHEAQKNAGEVRNGQYQKRQDAISKSLSGWSSAFRGGGQ